MGTSLWRGDSCNLALPRADINSTHVSWEPYRAREEDRYLTGDARRCLHASFVENCTAEYGKMRTTLVPLPLQNALTPSSLQQCLSAQALQVTLIFQHLDKAANSLCCCNMCAGWRGRLAPVYLICCLQNAVVHIRRRRRGRLSDGLCRGK